MQVTTALKIVSELGKRVGIKLTFTKCNKIRLLTVKYKYTILIVFVIFLLNSEASDMQRSIELVFGSRIYRLGQGIQFLAYLYGETSILNAFQM